MGGWIALIGDTPDFDNRLAEFKKTFSVSGVPGLQVDTSLGGNLVRTISWAWNKDRIPDVYVKVNDQGHSLLLCGVITDLGRFGPVQGDQEWTAARVLELWVKHQDELIGQLNGSFSCLFCDPNKNSASLFTDRFASRSVWFTQENNIYIAGNFPSALAAIKKNKLKFNPVGLWSLFNTGRHVGRHGLYHNINCLPAGEKAVLSHGGRPVVTKWRQRRYRPDNSLSAREWGRVIAQALKKSGRRYQKICASPHIFLSGGLDSRIAAASFGKPLKAVSLCTNPNAETRLASMVSKAIGIEHRIIVRSPHWYLDTLDAAALISSGNFLTCHTHFIVPASEITSENPDAEFLLGDLLENFNKHYFSVPVGCDLVYDPENIQKVLHSYVPYSIKGANRLGIYFKKEIRQQIERHYLTALQHYAEGLADVSPDHADRLDTFLRWADVSITPTYNMITCLWPMAGERNIFFDNEVDDLSLRIPSRIRAGGVLHRWTLHYLNKKLPLIPNANTFLPPVFPDRVGKFAKKVRPLLGRVRRNILTRQKNKPTLNTSGSWLLRGEMYRKDPRYRGRIEKTINDASLFPPDLFDPAQISMAWEGFLSGNADFIFDIDALLSFGALHKLIPCEGIEL